MKPTKRLISGVLSLLMLCSLCLTGLPTAAASAPGGAGLTGTIGLTIRFDLPQTAEEAAGRNIQLRLSGGGRNTTLSLPGGTAQGASIQVENVDGAPLTNESRVGYYRVELTGLSKAVPYELQLTGTGYVPFRTTVTLEGYSKHLIVGTGDGTFSLGDVNGDGVVDDKDLSAMDSRLGQTPSTPELAAFDLNGDGRLDVADLAYINHSKGNSGSAQVLDTAAIVPAQLEDTGRHHHPPAGRSSGAAHPPQLRRGGGAEPDSDHLPRRQRGHPEGVRPGGADGRLQPQRAL